MARTKAPAEAATLPRERATCPALGVADPTTPRAAAGLATIDGYTSRDGARNSGERMLNTAPVVKTFYVRAC